MSKRILFLAAAVVMAGAGIFFRAASTHTARVQADQIVAADTAGTDTTASIAALKLFAANHMGASVNFTLKGSYARASAAAAAAAATPAANSQVYADAQKACASKTDSITLARCNQAYLAQHLTTAPTPVPVPVPQLATYQYNFKGPWWTPDIAGALLLGAAAAALCGLIIGKSKGNR